MLVIITPKYHRETIHIVTDEVPDITDGILAVDEKNGDMRFFPLSSLHEFRIRTRP